MNKNRTFRYTMFGSLYFTQGTILSYFTALNAIYFLSRGLSMTDVGIFALIALIPFVLKIFLGMLSDKVNLFGFGHRKPYILVGLLTQAVCLSVVPFIDPAEYYWGFVVLAFIVQTGMALYDTCTDGLALDTTPKDEQGTIQGIMVGGRALGVIVVSSILGLLAEYVGWSAVFWTLSGLTLIPIPMVLGIKESERTEEDEFDWGAFGAFKQKSVAYLASLGFVFFFVIAGANQLVNPFLQTEFNISLSTAGYYTTIWGLGVVIGGFFGGRLYNRIGMKIASMIAIVIGLLGIGLLAFTPSPALAWVLVGLFGMAYGTQNTIYFALAMRFTDVRIAASMFSILMAATNVAQGAGMAVSGFMTDAVGYRVTFGILSLLTLLAFPLVYLVFRNRNNKAKAE